MFRSSYSCLFVAVFSVVGVGPAGAATYYLSPTGNDNNSGTTASLPKRTFAAYFNSSKPLQPGDTLVLLDGEYTVSQNGMGLTRPFVDINCGLVRTCTSCREGADTDTCCTYSTSTTVSGVNANNGTNATTGRITIRAHNERKALLTGNGYDVIRLRACRFWRIEGLRIRNVDNAAVPEQQGHGMLVTDSSRIEIVRNLIERSNRICPNPQDPGLGCNVHNLAVPYSDHVLVLENEIYYPRRHAYNAFASRNVSFVRNYSHSRGSGESNGSAALLYLSSNCLVVNNIDEQTERSLGTSYGANAQAMWGGTYGGRYNVVMGNISLDSKENGMIVKPRYGGVPRHNVYENNVIVRPGGNGVYFRSQQLNRVSYTTIVQAGSSGFVADQESPIDGQEFLCSDGSPNRYPAPSCDGCSTAGCGFNLNNVLVVKSSRDGLYKSSHYPTTNFRVSCTNSVANGGSNWNIGDTDLVNGYPVTQSFQTPLTGQGIGVGQGECAVWIPDNSNMKNMQGCGRIGAEILFAYRNDAPELTTQPLWRNSDGRFLGCGAVIPGVNDSEENSCIGVHKRLNINQNGCAFPAGYVGWGASGGTAPSKPSNLRLVP